MPDQGFFNLEDTKRVAKATGFVEKFVSPDSTPRARRKIPPRRNLVGLFPVLVTSEVAYNHYLCSVYENGFFDDAGTPQSATAVGQDLWILQINNVASVPLATIMFATKVGNHYEADVIRWL